MIVSKPRDKQPTGDEADAAWHERPQLLARIAELEATVTTLSSLLADARTATPSSDRGCCETAYIEGQKAAVKARLDADKTAKPKTEIVGVFPPGKVNHYHNASELVVRPTEDE
jgi:hypothetical protein